MTIKEVLATVSAGAAVTADCVHAVESVTVPKDGLDAPHHLAEAAHIEPSDRLSVRVGAFQANAFQPTAFQTAAIVDLSVLPAKV